MSDDSVAAVPELLTRAEFEGILRNATKLSTQLKEFTIEAATNVVGFLGEYYRVELSYFRQQPQQQQQQPAAAADDADDAEERQVKLFMKTLPSQLGEREKVLIFQKEAALYQTLLKELQKCSVVQWSPSCLYARDDLLVLEDLSARGYADGSASVKTGLSDARMRQLLRALAAMHAASIVYEAQSGHNIGVTYAQCLPEITVLPQIEWFTTSLNAINALARAHSIYRSHEQLLRTKLPERLASVYGMVQASAAYRNVLCHGDCWSGNVFFPKDEQRNAILVDYQTGRYCPPVVDLAVALHMNLNRAERRARLAEYLAFYYQQLTANLQHFNVAAAEHISEQELNASYRSFELFGYLYNAMVATIIRVPAKIVTNEYRYVDRMPNLSPYMRENSAFRLYMEDCIGDLLQVILDS